MAAMATRRDAPVLGALRLSRLRDLVAELEPRHFSFNSPFGACPACSGLGTRREVSEALVLGDPSISLLEGVILPWGEPDGYLRKVILPGLAKRYRFDLNTPWGDLSESVREVLLYGAGGRRGIAVDAASDDATRWEGILAHVQRRHDETQSDSLQMELGQYMVEVPVLRVRGSTAQTRVAGRDHRRAQHRANRRVLRARGATVSRRWRCDPRAAPASIRRSSDRS